METCNIYIFLKYVKGAEEMVQRLGAFAVLAEGLVSVP